MKEGYVVLKFEVREHKSLECASILRSVQLKVTGSVGLKDQL